MPPIYLLIKPASGRCNMRCRYCFYTDEAGLFLDDEWAAFLRKERFLVGLSIVGTTSVHNINRVDYKGEGTLRRVLDALHCLESVRLNLVYLRW